MSGASPPSFDQFFNAQTSGRQSSTSSSNIDPSSVSQHHNLTQSPYTDEPGQLQRRASQRSLHAQPSYQHQNSGDSSLSAAYTTFGQPRQESFPFDPQSSSTLIATAPLGAPGAQQQQQPVHLDENIGEMNIGDLMFSPQPQPFASERQHYSSHHNQMYPEQQNHDWNQHNLANQDSYVYDQGSPYDASSAYTPGQQSNTDWGNEFLSNPGTPADFGEEEQTASRLLPQVDQEQLDELERIISAASTPNFGPTDDARAPSPFQADHTSPYADALNQGRSASRSPSPFAQQYSAAPSPAPQRQGSTSPFAKPMSPPALIIPNSATPSLPSVLAQTQSMNQEFQDQGRRQSGQGGFGNSLMPPPNPNIPMSGMAGISPIHPTAGGPQIFVQPSTPISGLKDAKGIFDNALRKAALQQHQQQGQSQGNGQQNGQDGQYHSQDDGQQAYYSNEQQQQYADSANPQWARGGGSVDWQAYGLRTAAGARPRAKSDSFTDPAANANFDRQALLQAMAAAQGQPDLTQALQMQYGSNNHDLRDQIDSWRNVLVAEHQQSQQTGPTLDPRFLPGQDDERLQQEMAMNPLYAQQMAHLHAQRIRLPALNTSEGPTSQQGMLKYEPGEFSPTSLAFYQSLGINPGQGGGTASAPYSQTEFSAPPPFQGAMTANPDQGSFLIPGGGLGPRRRSFAEGSSHPAAGAGTPGYGVEFQRSTSPFGSLGMPLSRPMGHRRAVQSEDFGRMAPAGTGWGVGAGGSTTDFLQSITAMDGTLLPPARGRSHSRHSSASSNRSPSPALSISSQGSSYSHHSQQRMDMPDGVLPPGMTYERRGSRVAKMKVTSVATEVASASRRTNEGVFRCPIPGCGSTFTRHFNLKGHLRSHNDERPYKCLYEGCPKSIVGFARQHDCKRHMLLHEGLRPFECEGCGKQFARLDALTRHHKSEQGQECAISHPLPVNPDGTAMSESQYKQYRASKLQKEGKLIKANHKLRRETSNQSGLSGEGEYDDEDLGTGSGMDDYDQASDIGL